MWIVQGHNAVPPVRLKLATNRTCVKHSTTELPIASSDFCCQLITFANSLDPDQDRQKVGPDLDPNRLTLSVPERIF